jgi:diguanylate cyclase (GGDEF)-like protein
VSLRARLTGAFLAVVIGPVLLGAVFVALTVNSVNKSRERDRLDVAVTALRTAVDATCARLQATAETAATLTAGGTRPAVAQTLVTSGKASAIHIESATGTEVATTAGAPAPPWALCEALPPSLAAPFVDHDFTAVAAVVQMSNPAGRTIGYVYAAQRLDFGYLHQLATSAGADLTVVADPKRSTADPAAAPHLARAAAKLAGAGAAAGVGQARSQYVRQLQPLPGQPLAFAVSVPIRTTNSLFVTIIAVVLFAALASIGAAWALAGSTTKPLEELAEAADRVAHGELSTRVPVRHDDEVGHLGAAFNRMTREMQSYVYALTASRDQLRSNLTVLGDTLSSSHDLPRILHVILASALRATGARAGAVLLTDPIDAALTCQCWEGFDEPTAAAVATLRVPYRDGLVGSVAATGRARRGGTGEAVELAPGEPRVRTFLAVPMALPRLPTVESDGDATKGAGHWADVDWDAIDWHAPDEPAPADIRGVLALYDRLGDDDFDDNDLRTVRAFAGHAAVAVDNVRRHEEARRLSHTDPLTGLYNYRHLKELLEREVSRASRYGHSLCVMVLDLDRFKQVNDTYGHAAGDAVLVEFARRIGGVIRGPDLAFRYGGEEFVLLLPETDGLGGITLAQRLGAVVRETPITVYAGVWHSPGGVEPRSSTDITVTVSIGIAVFPDHGLAGPHVLEAADAALYAAKAAGRDTFRLAVAPDDTIPGIVIDASERSGIVTPRAPSGRPALGPGGASGTPQPPRQARGR